LRAMEWLALAIVVSVSLVLIDKNQKWETFWQVLKWSTAALILMIGAIVLWLNPAWREWLFGNDAALIPVMLCFAGLGIYIVYLAVVGWKTLLRKKYPSVGI
jgi:hypothetical protein